MHNAAEAIGPHDSSARKVGQRDGRAEILRLDVGAFELGVEGVLDQVVARHLSRHPREGLQAPGEDPAPADLPLRSGPDLHLSAPAAHRIGPTSSL
jgi:hypothetical protein